MKLLFVFAILMRISPMCEGQTSSYKKFVYDEGLSKRLGGNKYGISLG